MARRKPGRDDRVAGPVAVALAGNAGLGLGLGLGVSGAVAGALALGLAGARRAMPKLELPKFTLPKFGERPAAAPQSKPPDAPPFFAPPPAVTLPPSRGGFLAGRGLDAQRAPALRLPGALAERRLFGEDFVLPITPSLPGAAAGFLTGLRAPSRGEAFSAGVVGGDAGASAVRGAAEAGLRGLFAIGGGAVGLARQNLEDPLLPGVNLPSYGASFLFKRARDFAEGIR